MEINKEAVNESDGKLDVFPEPCSAVNFLCSYYISPFTIRHPFTDL